MQNDVSNEVRAKFYTAIAKAQADAVAVQKDAENKFHHYHYASTEAMITEAKSIMPKHGLALRRISNKIMMMLGGSAPVEIDQGDTRAKAVAPPPAMLLTVWRLSHADGAYEDHSCEWPIVPEKGRPFDKATAAADTATLGYLVRDILMLPRVAPGTDLDDDARQTERQSGGQPTEQSRRDEAPAINSLVVQYREKLIQCQSLVTLVSLGASAAQDAAAGKFDDRSKSALSEAVSLARTRVIADLRNFFVASTDAVSVQRERQGIEDVATSPFVIERKFLATDVLASLREAGNQAVVRLTPLRTQERAQEPNSGAAPTTPAPELLGVHCPEWIGLEMSKWFLRYGSSIVESTAVAVSAPIPHKCNAQQLRAVAGRLKELEASGQIKVPAGLSL